MSKASSKEPSGHSDADHHDSWEALYSQLRALASERLKRESNPDMLQPTALVNEAWLRMDSLRMQFNGREHFLAMAATVMRRVLVDQARSLGREKRPDADLKVTFTSRISGSDPKPVALLDIDHALTELAELDARRAQILEMHYFAGMTYDEIGAELDISPATVKRDLRSARAWLSASLGAVE